jgi:hypothetical protein
VSATEKWVLDPPEEDHVAFDGYHVIHAGEDRIAGFVPDDVARLIAAAPALYEALTAMLADVQDEHEAHEAEDEGFIVAAHVPYGDVLRARAALSAARPAPTEDET